jgi:D-psicose/D-tagatose/L-ribulose 3-epimerase
VIPCGMAGDTAKPHGITIAIEHLRRQETNIINTVGEALRLARDTDHPNVRIVVDYYHLRHENESPDVLREARPLVVHLHFANPAGRVWPKRADEDPFYRHYFRVVREIGYRGGLTIEAPNGSMAKDAPEALRFFDEMLR